MSTYREREAKYRATLGPEELARYDAWIVEADRQEAELRAKMSPAELAGYLAWEEALDVIDEGGEVIPAGFCNKPVDFGKCILWPCHGGDCTRYMGP